MGDKLTVEQLQVQLDGAEQLGKLLLKAKDRWASISRTADSKNRDHIEEIARLEKNAVDFDAIERWVKLCKGDRWTWASDTGTLTGTLTACYPPAKADSFLIKAASLPEASRKCRAELNAAEDTERPAELGVQLAGGILEEALRLDEQPEPVPEVSALDEYAKLPFISPLMQRVIREIRDRLKNVEREKRDGE